MTIDMDREEASKLLTWLLVYQNRFDRQKVNQNLLKYATGVRELIYFTTSKNSAIRFPYRLFIITIEI
ncbi:hypothetical protein H6G76_22790 [Nostoc sp. FACHB-152]|uniref:hypothetical protein n=1 Tax=unclassified Nostoc TaxID=2593658 RepID=UPI0016835222|nr:MULTISPECIES: hypothetical protein [unclassified Nostoc]MBD2449938.1 hypothetical protein [Nostoc sp. FACHB-152]MBD2468470.1 hypothetical protein [Nostoc sp. FACHB-145]